MEWIKITEDVPKTEGKYKVRRRFTNDVEVGYFTGKEFTNYQGYAVIEWLDETTHDVSQKRYSKEDILKAIELAREFRNASQSHFSFDYTEDEIFQSLSPITETKTNGDAEEGQDFIEKIAIDFTNNKLKIVSGLLSDDYKMGFKEGVENYIEWQKKQPHT